MIVLKAPQQKFLEVLQSVARSDPVDEVRRLAEQQVTSYQQAARGG